MFPAGQREHRQLMRSQLSSKPDLPAILLSVKARDLRKLCNRMHISFSFKSACLLLACEANHLFISELTGMVIFPYILKSRACFLLFGLMKRKAILGRFKAMEKTLNIGIKRGFSTDKLRKIKDPRVKKDQGGHYLNTVNENVKVYFEDFYSFLEKVEENCLDELRDLREKMLTCERKMEETQAYYCARKIVVEVILKNVYGYYGEDSSFAVIMSPWCFGTVVLEKIINYKERLARGEIPDVNLQGSPYKILRYVDEICKGTILDMLRLPPEAFLYKWQYTELLKNFAKVFAGIYENLANILSAVREQHQENSDSLT
jgi:hypothetical protein